MARVGQRGGGKGRGQICKRGVVRAKSQVIGGTIGMEEGGVMVWAWQGRGMVGLDSCKRGGVE